MVMFKGGGLSKNCVIKLMLAIPYVNFFIDSLYRIGTFALY